MGSVNTYLYDQAPMNMSKDRPDKHKAADQDVSIDDARLEERKRIWMICMTFLLCTIFILVYSFTNDKVDSVVKFIGYHLNLGPLTVIMSRQDRTSPAKNWYNLLVEESSNYTSTLTNLLHLNATSDSECYHVKTTKTVLDGLPESIDGKFFFQTDMTHHLTLLAYEENGKKRCAGGDYYEVDFHDRDNVIYKSRLPTVDFGNGSYGLELFVPSRFAGDFTLEIWLLVGNWRGLDSYMEHAADPTREPPELMLTLSELQMGTVRADPNYVSPHDQAVDPKNLTQCTQADFNRTTWKGRWTRSWYNVSCGYDYEMRFHCLPEEHYWCEEPWCFGPVGRLESNGWQYSAHCSFKIFQAEEAWKCLDGRWILVWGDSNAVDSIRNLLFFILGWNLPPGETLADFHLERSYEAAFINPLSYAQRLNVSQVFNGNYNIKHDGLGMDSLRNLEHQQLLLDHFKGRRWPDTIIMNSGLHDAVKHETIESYAEAADFTIAWWMQLYDSIPADRRPQLVWRSNVATAGLFWRMSWTGNPNQMEMYNLVMVEKLQKVRDKFPVKIVDAFDLSFPFHYTNEYSDGAHYGRQPGAKGQAHWYFVDLMLVHIFLNAICPSPA